MVTRFYYAARDLGLILGLDIFEAMLLHVAGLFTHFCICIAQTQWLRNLTAN